MSTPIDLTTGDDPGVMTEYDVSRIPRGNSDMTPDLIYLSKQFDKLTKLQQKIQKIMFTDKIMSQKWKEGQPRFKPLKHKIRVGLICALLTKFKQELEINPPGVQIDSNLQEYWKEIMDEFEDFYNKKYPVYDLEFQGYDQETRGIISTKIVMDMFHRPRPAQSQQQGQRSTNRSNREQQHRNRRNNRNFPH
jgi:hypothetical protein